MKYNFDKETNRFNTSSYKWDVKENELPMWVADMDFETSPAIVKGFKKRIDHGVFGYVALSDDFYNSYIYWFKKRHHFNIKKEWIIFSTGVIPTLSSAIRRVSEVANNIVIMTPVYNIFFNSILNNGRHVLTSPLIYKDGKYEIDFIDLEAKLALEETTVLILCNPHNPVGKIWSKDELDKIGKLCAKYNVTVISDEIHGDLTRTGLEYIPFASVSKLNAEISITCVAPTKAFNLAGIQTSAIIIPNPKLKHLVERGLNTDECAEPNVLAEIAPFLAYKESEDWLDELRLYLDENIREVNEFIKNQLPQIALIKCEATYLLWLDCSKITKDADKLQAYIRETTGLYLSSGSIYGKEGNTFLRMNIATTKARVIDGLKRLKKAIDSYKEN
ncbi:MAG: pyridoxal phosphate-dependent aminotransferase [Bacilli bacterium]|nr:pyridoxal phosphate-dependent aminotransferase [Bacilli bacterium]